MRGRRFHESAQPSLVAAIGVILAFAATVIVLLSDSWLRGRLSDGRSREPIP
jgi:hypothetical protein